MTDSAYGASGSSPPDLMTAAGFLTERHDFLYVYPTRSISNAGYDVVVRVDGTYHSFADAKEAAEGIRQWIESLSDVSGNGRDWWNGAPWQRKADR